MSHYDLNHHVYRLLMSEPFFAYISREVNKSASTSIPTAGIRVNPDTHRYEMLYNPEFFSALSDEQAKGVLKHEFYHAIFEHVTQRLPDNENMKIWNIATDLAINSIIGENELPEICLFPGKGKFENYPEDLASETYLAMLKNNPQFQPKEGDENGENGNGQQGEGGGNDGQFDSHEHWGDEASQNVSEIAKERFREAMSRAANECAKNNSWGSLSSEVRQEIMKRIQTKVDWKKVLRYFVGRAQKSDRTNTIRKINKRFPYIHAGRKTNYSAHIAIAIDQSGSVSDEMLNEFYNELNKLSALATFTVVPFDDKVFDDKVYTWKKGEKRKWQRVLSGGTNFNAPTEYVNKNSKFDALLILTDMYAEKPKSCKVQRAWMTTSYNKRSMPFQTNELILTVDN